MSISNVNAARCCGREICCSLSFLFLISCVDGVSIFKVWLDKPTSIERSPWSNATAVWHVLLLAVLISMGLKTMSAGFMCHLRINMLDLGIGSHGPILQSNAAAVR